MNKLWLFGTPAFRAATPGAESTPALQPKRVALLAYLALGSPQRAYSRDTLVGLFWPEAEQRSARASLRKALHFLREALGAEAVESGGNEQIRLGTERLWCDVLEFRSACERGDPAHALELYGGDLLEGVYVSGAPEFDRWLELERFRLRASAVAAALGLAEQAVAGGELSDALGWALRARRIAPENEAALRLVLTILIGQGDLVGAQRAFEKFAAWLEAEYGSAPSAQTRRVLEMAVPAAPAAPRPPGAPPADDLYRDIVASMVDVVYRADPDGYLTFVNPAGLRLMGCPADQLLGRCYLDFVREDHRDAALEFYLRQLQERTPTTYYEVPLVTRSGRELWIAQHVQLLERDGAVVGIQALARDVTARKRTQDAQRNLALVDRATGLYNARAFETLAEERLKLARREGLELGRLLVAVRNLRDLCAEHGEAAGEAGLRAVGEAIRRTFRASDLAARIGDGEFVVLTTRLGANADAVRHRLHDAVRRTAAEAGLPAPLEVDLVPAPYAGELPGSGTALLQPAPPGRPAAPVAGTL